MDNFTPPQAPVPPQQQAPAPAPGGGNGKGFFASRNGRIVLGAIGIIAVLGILGAVAFVFLGGSGSGDLATTPPASSTSPSGGTSGSAAATGDRVAPEAVPITDVFTFRDVFEPTVKPAVIATPTASTTTSGTSTTVTTTSTSTSANSSTDDTLYLQDIVTEDGESVAVFLYNGQTYRLTEGGRVGDTPWEVLEIGEDSVVMLYGDTQVTLSVGQGLTK